MRQVRIHLDHRVVAARKRIFEPGHVCGPEAGLAGTVEDAHTLLVRGYVVCELAGSVRRVVVGHQDVDVGRRGQEARNHLADRSGFVVGGHDDADLHCSPLIRRTNGNKVNSNAPAPIAISIAEP